MADAQIIPLRFQSAELKEKANLSPAGVACLMETAHPVRLIEALRARNHDRDALHALCLILPHRQSVWWACLAARLMPDLARNPDELAAVEAAERWVQSAAPGDAEQAGVLAEACDNGRGAHWVATAAFWSGPSLAPRGQQPVPPAPYLPGVAVRAALLLFGLEPGLAGRVTPGDWMTMGLALMRGENGRQAQAAVRAKLFPA